MKSPTGRPTRAAWRALVLVVVYVVLDVLFARETQTRGLLSPGGAPHFGVVLLGAAYLALRIVVRFLLPAEAAFAVARAVAARLLPSRAAEDAPTSR